MKPIEKTFHAFPETTISLDKDGYLLFEQDTFGNGVERIVIPSYMIPVFISFLDNILKGRG